MAGWNDFSASHPEAVAAGAPVGVPACGGALMHVEAWSDGSSRGNPGPGGHSEFLSAKRYMNYLSARAVTQTLLWHVTLSRPLYCCCPRTFPYILCKCHLILCCE